MSQILNLGPAQGDLLLRTGVEGKAARLGHRLTIAVTAWECKALLDDGKPTSLAFTAQLGSLEVVKGDGGAKPLSDKDRRTIKESASKTLGTDKNPALDYKSTSIDDGYVVHGDVTLHGVTAPLDIAVTVTPEGDGDRVVATAALRQSDFGIKPYSQMLGALQVSDEVQIELEVVIPRS